MSKIDMDRLVKWCAISIMVKGETLKRYELINEEHGEYRFVFEDKSGKERESVISGIFGSMCADLNDQINVLQNKDLGVKKDLSLGGFI